MIPSHRPTDLYYRRLELGQGASQEEIVRAYRRLAQGVHPDTHPEDPEASRRFREITEAYEVLTNPARRARYERDQASGVGRTIRVVVRRAPEPSWGSAEVPRDLGGEGPPVVLGASRRVARDAPLRAGPVRIEAHEEGQAEDRSASRETPEERLWQMFSDVLESLWRR
jgi:curved DNA-binding protein CbpA